MQSQQTKPRFSLIADETLQRRPASGEAADQVSAQDKPATSDGPVSTSAKPQWPQARRDSHHSRLESDRTLSNSAAPIRLYSLSYSLQEAESGNSELVAEIKGSENFCRINQHSWLIGTGESAEELTQRMQNFLGPKDTLLVTEISGEVNGWSSQYVWAWLTEIRTRVQLSENTPNSMAPDNRSIFANGSRKAQNLYPKRPTTAHQVAYASTAKYVKKQ